MACFENRDITAPQHLRLSRSPVPLASLMVNYKVAQVIDGRELITLDRALTWFECFSLFHSKSISDLSLSLLPTFEIDTQQR